MVERLFLESVTQGSGSVDRVEAGVHFFFIFRPRRVFKNLRDRRTGRKMETDFEIEGPEARNQ